MEKRCPICDTTLRESHKPRPYTSSSYPAPNPTHWTDYSCQYGINHSYSIRYLEEELVKTKIRLQEGNDKIFFLLHHQDDRLEIWTQPGQTNRVIIAGLFEPDFTDIVKLREKLKTYVTFA